MVISRFKSIQTLSGIVLISLVWLWACDLRADQGIICPTITQMSDQNSETAPCHSSESETGQQSSHCFHCLETADFDSNTEFPSLLKQSIETISFPPNKITGVFDSIIQLNNQTFPSNTLYLVYKSDHLLQNSQRFRI